MPLLNSSNVEEIPLSLFPFWIFLKSMFWGFVLHLGIMGNKSIPSFLKIVLQVLEEYSYLPLLFG